MPLLTKVLEVSMGLTMLETMQAKQGPRELTSYQQVNLGRDKSGNPSEHG